MRVSDASPWQVLFAPGRKAMLWPGGLPEDELQVCRGEGFETAVLLPAWSDGALSRNFYDLTTGESPVRSNTYSDALLYLGPVRLKKSVGGLKKWHVFLVDGSRIALHGYEFVHLTSQKPL